MANFFMTKVLICYYRRRRWSESTVVATVKRELTVAFVALNRVGESAADATLLIKGPRF